MSRIQLALNVSDLDEAVAFYAKLFATEPAKLEAGYANFAVDQPPLKLILVENPDAAERLNHLGVEVSSSDEVIAASARFAEQGLITATEEGVGCCYAVQDKVWVQDPDGAPWETYTVLADIETPQDDLHSADLCGAGACATTDLPADQVDAQPVRACC